jgi:hypothetical protein
MIPTYVNQLFSAIPNRQLSAAHRDSQYARAIIVIPAFVARGIVEGIDPLATVEPDAKVSRLCVDLDRFNGISTYVFQSFLKDVYGSRKAKFLTVI